MEPAFYRGDILFLHMGFTPFRAGDIVVFKVADREIPIVHRIIKVRVVHGACAPACAQPQAARATGGHAAPRPVQTRARRAASGAREGERRGGHIDQGR